MRKLLALLALLALAAAPAVACDYPAPVALGVAPHCACPDPAALGYSAAASVQTYQAPVVQLAPVVQSYQSATVALPTVTHGYAASGFGASSGYGAFGSGYNAFSPGQFRAHRHAEHSFAQARFGGNTFGSGRSYAVFASSGHGHGASFARGNAFVGHGRNGFAGRNQAFNRGFVAGRRAGAGRRREGIVTRALRAPGRILGGLFGR